jgi:Uma2 family endonuclease
VASKPVLKLTEEQNLAIERAAEFRREFVDGEMFAMSGGTNRHGRIQRNLIVELGFALEDGTCEPFGSDSRFAQRSCIVQSGTSPGRAFHAPAGWPMDLA